MCRNIKPLFNYDPKATDEEVQNASLQFVRKISGCTKPSSVNESAFNSAVEEVALVTKNLLSSLTIGSHSRNREVESERAQLRSVKRFG